MNNTRILLNELEADALRAVRNLQASMSIPTVTEWNLSVSGDPKSERPFVIAGYPHPMPREFSMEVAVAETTDGAIAKLYSFRDSPVKLREQAQELVLRAEILERSQAK